MSTVFRNRAKHLPVEATHVTELHKCRLPPAIVVPLRYGAQQRQQPPDKNIAPPSRLRISSTPARRTSIGRERCRDYGVRLGGEAGHLLPNVHSGKKGPGGDHGVHEKCLSVCAEVSFT